MGAGGFGLSGPIEGSGWVLAGVQMCLSLKARMNPLEGHHVNLPLINPLYYRAKSRNYEYRTSQASLSFYFL